MEINADGRIATIDGVDTLKGADVLATDLRAGAAMVIAGLAAEGETRIGNIRLSTEVTNRLSINLEH